MTPKKELLLQARHLHTAAELIKFPLSFRMEIL